MNRIEASGSRKCPSKDVRGIPIRGGGRLGEGAGIAGAVKNYRVQGSREGISGTRRDKMRGRSRRTDCTMR